MDTHNENKTAMGQSYYYNGESSIGKTVSLYWNGPHFTSKSLFDVPCAE